jgi:hypothetical protein
VPSKQMDWWVGIFFLFAIIEDMLGVLAASDHVTQDSGATDLCTQTNSQDFGTHSLNYTCAATPVVVSCLVVVVPHTRHIVEPTGRRCCSRQRGCEEGQCHRPHAHLHYEYMFPGS